MKTKSYLFIILSLLLMLNINCKKAENNVPIKGVINFISGTVKIINSKGEINIAKVGDEIIQGMKIETIGKNSFTDIYIGTYIIKVLGNTKVEVQRLFENLNDSTKQVKFDVQKGNLFSKITTKLSKGDSYEVTTATAVAAVRGTEFLVSSEKDKSNVACLSGMVSVLNSSLSGSSPLILDPKEETDVIPGENMVKKQISADRLRRMNILLNIKQLREDIRKKFEEQREEIRKHVEEQREKNKEILEAQKEKDKVLVEEQKKKDKENVANIKGQTNEAATEAVDTAKKQMETVKVDKESATKEAEEKMQSVKPTINKDQFKVNKDQFKPKADNSNQ